MNTLNLLTSALSRVNSLTATFDSLEKDGVINKVGAGRAKFDEVITSETRQTETEIIDALDQLDGDALAETLKALDEVRNLRQVFFMLKKDSAKRAYEHAKNAKSAMSSAVDKVNSLPALPFAK